MVCAWPSFLQENLLLRQGSPEKPRLTGESRVRRALKKQIEMIAPTDAWVLIRGDHGTSKGLVAQVHTPRLQIE